MVQKSKSSRSYCLPIMAAMEAVKGKKYSLEFEPSRGLIPCDPVAHYSEVPTTVTIRPNIGSKTYLSSRSLK